MLEQELLRSAAATTDSVTALTSDDTSLSLVCDENFGSGSLTDSTAVSPSRESSPDMTTFLALADALVLDVRVQRARQRCAEAREMRAAVALRDVVRVAEHALPDSRRSTGSATSIWIERAASP